MKDLSFMFSESWVTPRSAADDVADLCGTSREQAIDSLSMRLASGYLVAMVKRVAGVQVPGSALEPSFVAQVIPASLWEHEAFCSPTSTVWWTGDLRLPTTEGVIMLMSVRLIPLAVEQTVRDLGFSQLPQEGEQVKASDLALEPLINPEVTQYQRGFSIYDAPFVAEIIRRKSEGEFRSITDGAKRVLIEKLSAGKKIEGNSDDAIIKRWQRDASKRIRASLQRDRIDSRAEQAAIKSRPRRARKPHRER